MNSFLEKMLTGVGDIQQYPYSHVPCHYNSLGNSKSITWEIGILLKNFVEWKRPNSIVEIGTFRGYSTSWLILGTLLNEMGWVRTFDVMGEGFFGKMWYDFYDLPKERFSFEHIPGGIWSWREKLPAKIDLLFHDSSHELEDTIREMECLLPLVTPGGIILFDDMLHPNYAPMQGYLHTLFVPLCNWKWSVIQIGTGLGVAERLQ